MVCSIELSELYASQSHYDTCQTGTKWLFVAGVICLLQHVQFAVPICRPQLPVGSYPPSLKYFWAAAS